MQDRAVQPSAQPAGQQQAPVQPAQQPIDLRAALRAIAPKTAPSPAQPVAVPVPKHLTHEKKDEPQAVSQSGSNDTAPGDARSGTPRRVPEAELRSMLAVEPFEERAHEQ
jgi:hypothetical protein